MTLLKPFVEQRAQALGLTLSELCRRADISRQTLYSLLHDTQRLPTLDTVMAVAQALQVIPLRLLQLLCEQHAKTRPRSQRRVRVLRGDQSAFVRDVTYPDGELVLPGQRFLKVWELQNVGEVPWDNRWLRCVDEELVVYSRSGELLRLAQNLTPSVQAIRVPRTLPGQTVQLCVEFTAPLHPGTVMSYWRSTHDDGQLCFPSSRGMWVKVQVSQLAAAGSHEAD
jgi:transcriptional regulator with XRE-family HTH domain